MMALFNENLETDQMTKDNMYIGKINSISKCLHLI